MHRTKQLKIAIMVMNILQNRLQNPQSRIEGGINY